MSCKKVGAHRIGCPDCAREPLRAEIERLKRELAIERKMRMVARKQCTEAERRAVDLALSLQAPGAPAGRSTDLICSTPGTCSGCPRLDGTRLCVHDIVSQVRLNDGDVFAWWCEDYPYLTLQQVLAALGYYAAHQTEIDQILDEWRRDYESLDVI